MYKIVIIEDQEITRNNLASFLIRKNYKVSATSNGTNGLKKIFSEKPDIVICDIMLPDITGFQILSTIREDN